jgi:hypothetical protein
LVGVEAVLSIGVAVEGTEVTDEGRVGVVIEAEGAGEGKGIGVGIADEGEGFV